MRTRTRKHGLQTAILRVMEEKPNQSFDVDALRRRLGAEWPVSTSYSSALNRLVELGEIRRTGRGVYRLVDRSAPKTFEGVVINQTDAEILFWVGSDIFRARKLVEPR